MEAFLIAIDAVFEPARLLALFGGVLAGLIIGVIPGLSGIFGLALLVPLTYSLDPFAAIALLLGLGSVTTTSDTIPAVLIGVPGTAGAMATVEDGFPLAKNGEARRAFGAAYSASLIGGLFGAVVLLVSIPVIRPLILTMRTPDFLAISVLGLLFVSMLAGSRPIAGLMAAGLGLLFAQIGIDGQTAEERFTFGQIYLWDGIPLTVVFLGLFALPELAGLLGRNAISEVGARKAKATLADGMRDSIREWRLVLQGSTVGALMGAVPGVGVVVIEWIAYGLARRDRRGGPVFGTGNIRGVIGPEAANNAKEGGALIPTIAFGLPGSASMSILLGAFVIHGLVPGPDMLDRHLPVTYAMVLTVALANVLGALICLWLTCCLARIATISTRVVVPVALVFVVLGAFQASRSVEDIWALCFFGALGMGMKSLNWPRAPFALGFVLGPMIERYYFLSRQLTGWEWLMRPSVLIVLAVFAFILFRHYRKIRATKAASEARKGSGCAYEAGASVVMILMAVSVLAMCRSLPEGAALFPGIVSSGLLILAVMSLASIWVQGVGRSPARPRVPLAEAAVFGLILAFTFLLHGFGVLVACAAIPAVVILSERPRRWLRAAISAAGVAVVVHVLFNEIMSIPWPRPWLEAVFL